MASRSSTARRRSGISPWIPNQHGAWAMLIIPAVLGLVAGIRVANGTADAIVIAAVEIAWFFGYGAFFAFGLAARARTRERRRPYLRPVYVYGSVSLLMLTIILIIQPSLAWWACAFAPLIGIALWETLRRRPRSLVSGVATVVASALLVPVMASITQADGLPQPPAAALTSAAFLAIYFSGTVPLVKTVVRERGNRAYFYGSVAFHVIGLAVVAALPLGGWAKGLMIATMIIAIARAIIFPVLAQRGYHITPKKVGITEAFVSVVATLGVFIAVLS